MVLVNDDRRAEGGKGIYEVIKRKYI